MQYHYMLPHERTLKVEQKKLDTKSKHSKTPLRVGFSLGNGYSLEPFSVAVNI